MQLFDFMDSTENPSPEMAPLAERMRPHSLAEFLGQQHLTESGSLIRSFVDNKAIFSLILWGPPGTGKTTLAHILAKETGAKFYALNAVSSSVKDVRAIIEKAMYYLNNKQRVILFIDEIHRYNKAQQDALLHAVEKGIVSLIGATTENPSFEVNSALLSRCRVITLKSLNDEALAAIVKNALANDLLFKEKNITIDDECLKILVTSATGDARKMLNLLDIAVQIAPNQAEIVFTKELIKNALQTSLTRYDKKGDMHYDVISAFIKSVRGSDPDAALYYLARMIEAGEDPAFIARRLIILASEDIGNASPNALLLAKAAYDSVEVIGMPESRIILGQVTTYLAGQPKSNAAYLGIDAALAEVRSSGDLPQVPIHLRNAPTRLMKDLGYGKEYKYSHDFPDHFVAQQFLPDVLKDKQFYQPTEVGLEKSIKDRLKALWKGWKKY